jgi:acyl-CoA thioesterase I
VVSPPHAPPARLPRPRSDPRRRVRPRSSPQSLAAIVAEIRRDTGAKVAICSLPPIGEDLGSPLNRALADYNAAVREIAEQAGVAYLPVHEALVERLRADPPSPARAYGGGSGPMLAAMIERHVLGKSYDAIGRGNGFTLLSDGIHLGEEAAAIVERIVEGFLRG